MVKKKVDSMVFSIVENFHCNFSRSALQTQKTVLLRPSSLFWVGFSGFRLSCRVNQWRIRKEWEVIKVWQFSNIIRSLIKSQMNCSLSLVEINDVIICENCAEKWSFRDGRRRCQWASIRLNVGLFSFHEYILSISLNEFYGFWSLMNLIITSKSKASPLYDFMNESCGVSFSHFFYFFVSLEKHFLPSAKSSFLSFFEKHSLFSML